ncbi:UNVERIFIED_CONTAM: hypothetical protein Sradi_6907000 [Sesamum radiatum]|uniref:Reverse transcriptase zinc-binding domain-containing protein n=1 Tax=Sesamum radiatum TaxID=300843 RepID=A0AAW2JI44_SESRA
MLAKQVWRIIMKPDALLSRILKQKYFPSTDVFQAVAGPGCSFTWRSIISARDLLSAVCDGRWERSLCENLDRGLLRYSPPKILSVGMPR